MKTIGVISERMAISVEFVDELVGGFKINELDYYINSPNRYEVHLKNGDVYKALTTTKTLDGLRFDKLYVHIDTVDKEFRDSVVPRLSPVMASFRL